MITMVNISDLLLLVGLAFQSVQFDGAAIGLWRSVLQGCHSIYVKNRCYCCQIARHHVQLQPKTGAINFYWCQDRYRNYLMQARTLFVSINLFILKNACSLYRSGNNQLKVILNE